MKNPDEFRKRWNAFLKSNLWFDSPKKVLVGVSGGVDSMVLLHLFHYSGIPVFAAHCNFNLRGPESDGDEALVKEYCEAHAIPFYSKRFDTKEYASREKCSVQMAARELRYDWLMGLTRQNGLDYLATAHHADDQVETFWINIIRGAGLKGMQGIPIQRDNIIRPLLFAKKEEILSFAAKQDIPFRTDSSNRQEKYFRNKLRLNILPQLRQLNPGLDEVVLREMALIKEAYAFQNQQLDKICQEFVFQKNDVVYIRKSGIVSSDFPLLVLHHILQQYDFNAAVKEDIIQGLNQIPGKKFYSERFVLLLDREYLLVYPKEENIPVEDLTFSIMNTAPCTSLQLRHFELTSMRCDERGLPLEMELQPRETGKTESVAIIKEDAFSAWVDASKLKETLSLGVWKKGEKFYPLGLGKQKKLSDFFIDLKLTMHQKERQMVLRSGEDIVWLPGLRLDDRFKIDKSTRRVIGFTWIKK